MSVKREKKFTKGPLEVDGTPELWPLILDKNGDLVAQVFHDDHDGEGNITTEQCEANGALFASAEGLLDELEEADAVLCQMCKRLNPQHADCTSCDDHDSRLAAIAKAYGESP